jgi:hypothetical protein
MFSWLGSSWFDYPLTRPVTLRSHFNVSILVLGVVYIVLITLINVAAVGYDSVSFISSSCNGTLTLWYDQFLPKTVLLPPSRTCQASAIKANEGFAFLSD